MLGLGGLRARIVAALVVTDVLTLLVTGVALLGPLDRRLRNDAVASLHDATLAARPGIADVLRADPSTSDLERAARSLRRRTGGEVAIFAADGHRVVSTDPDSGERFTEAARALRDDHTVSVVTTADGHSVAGVAAPVRADGRRGTRRGGRPEPHVRHDAQPPARSGAGPAHVRGHRLARAAHAAGVAAAHALAAARGPRR